MGMDFFSSPIDIYSIINNPLNMYSQSFGKDRLRDARDNDRLGNSIY